jgi:hypothetical protein
VQQRREMCSGNHSFWKEAYALGVEMVECGNGPRCGACHKVWHDLCAAHEGNREGWKCCEGRTVSPKRAGLRAAGAAAQAEQGDKMRKRAAACDGEGELLPVGTVVQLHLDDVDRAKLDFTNATLVVVDHLGVVSHVVANRAYVYKDKVSRAYLRPVPGSTPELVGLQDVLLGWKGMPKVGIRQIAAVLSPAAGQGLVHCSCKGSCEWGKCACRKAGRLSNSRCHKGSKECQNHK